MGRKDITEKILESYNDVFADIVNVLLFDGRIREIERDVAKRWAKQNIRIACVGLENQTHPDPICRSV